ncbi:acyl-CoA thioesterase [Nocardioides caeni]|uniref:Acyl-CoA thioesterase n=1 Tax=Nocardioides caeni TaxID=574700 RepID=A0A4S8NM06_9ACTN|nr:acyl-CoA thioesterase [Nocardioides caeni]
MTAVWSAPVRYAECDQQGVVFNGHYLTWADEAATAWWIAVGMPYDELAVGGDTMVKAAALSWRSSARWGETVTVDARLASLGRTSLSLELDVRVDDRHCCTVTMTYVWVEDGAAAPWPERVRAALSQ